LRQGEAIIRIRLLGTARVEVCPRGIALPELPGRRGSVKSPAHPVFVAISSGNGKWFLVNASPDLPFQIEAFSDLNQVKTCFRDAHRGVLLTNADLDHALGLFSLREGGG